MRDDQYVLNHCTKYLARDNTDQRHSFSGIDDGKPRARLSEAWRFPIVDSHDGDEADAYEWNDVTFVYAIARDGPVPAAIELVSTCVALNAPVALKCVGDSIFWACTLKVRKGERHRYVFLVEGNVLADPVNPQTQRTPSGETWSSFFTWAATQPVTFERWEFVILERLTRHVLPFKTKEAENFLKRGANEGNVGHLYRLDVSVGVTNYIDKALAREERHQLYAYKTCLEMIDAVLRRRHPGKDPEFVDKSSYERLYNEMAANGTNTALFQDGWDRSRYESPFHFLYLLRRHAITGAFAHPKYGGNAGGMAWAYLGERYAADGGATAFDWRKAIEPPLGASTEYRG